MENNFFENSARMLLKAILAFIKREDITNGTKRRVLLGLNDLAKALVEGEEWGPREHVVVLGQTKVDKNDIAAILQDVGLPPVQFCDPFEDSNQLDALYSPHCRGVIIGPVPHSLPGNPRVILQEAGIPFVYAKNGADLKISKSSIRTAGEGLLKEIDLQAEADVSKVVS